MVPEDFSPSSLGPTWYGSGTGPMNLLVKAGCRRAATYLKGFASDSVGRQCRSSLT